MNDVRIFRFDASSCNGCDIEVLGILALGLPLNELGIRLVDTPQEANTLVVCGGVNIKSEAELEAIYELIEPPRRVIAIGSCALAMGVFKDSYSMTGPVDEIIPVDRYILGCPPRPQVIAAALADALNLDIPGLESLRETPAGFRGEPVVDSAKCLGCAACANSCPAGAIEIDNDGTNRAVKFTHKDCICCATCQEVCPNNAIALTDTARPWCEDKKTAISAATVALKKCLVCDLSFVSSQQVDWAMRKIDQKLRIPQETRNQLLRSSSLCPNCRRQSISHIKEAKRILTSIATRIPL